MSRRDPWRPPGLPHPTVQVRETRGRAVLAGVGVFAFLGGLTWLDLRELSPGLLAWIGGWSVFFWLFHTRHEVLAGTGWLSVRPVGRRRWVRTDRLVRLEVRHRYRGRSYAELLDDEGRRLRLPLSEVTPRLQDRLAADLGKAQQVGLLGDEVDVDVLVGHQRIARARRRR